MTTPDPPDDDLDLLLAAAAPLLAPADDPWERLAAGDLSSDERAQLEREDPERYALFAPLDDDFDARMLHTIASATAPSPEPWWTGLVAWWRAATAIQLAAPVLAIALLVPLGAVVGARTGAFDALTGRDADGVVLPTYELRVAVGPASVRGDPTGPAPLDPAGTLSMTLVPTTPVDGPVDVELAVAISSGVRPLPLPKGALEVDALGVIELSAPLGDLGLGSGDHDVRVTVYPQGSRDPDASWSTTVHVVVAGR